MTTYTTQEAAARFDEILRRVQGGERVLLVEEGKDVAEIRPLRQEEDQASSSVKAALQELEDQGVLIPAATPRQPFVPAGKRPGALARFLESRR
jgi:antitoxin (DNA-binding transcriptional repressor) of toxin-antitoxin stability system